MVNATGRKDRLPQRCKFHGIQIHCVEGEAAIIGSVVRLFERTFSSWRIGLHGLQGKSTDGINHGFQHIVRGLTICQTAQVIDPTT